MLWGSCFELGAVDAHETQKRATERIRRLAKVSDNVRNEEVIYLDCQKEA